MTRGIFIVSLSILFGYLPGERCKIKATQFVHIINNFQFISLAKLITGSSFTVYKMKTGAWKHGSTFNSASYSYDIFNAAGPLYESHFIKRSMTY